MSAKVRRFSVWVLFFVCWQSLGVATLKAALEMDPAGFLYFAIWFSLLVPAWRLYLWVSPSTRTD